MGAEALTDDVIQALLSQQKTVMKNPRSFKPKEGHLEMDFPLEGVEGDCFVVCVRQNVILPDAFSCGLRWKSSTGEHYTLTRYNGPSHTHRNKLEGNRIVLSCHIHQATERYLLAGLKIDGFAEETDRYATLEDAVRLMAKDRNIRGIELPPELSSKGRLFPC